MAQQTSQDSGHVGDDEAPSTSSGTAGSSSVPGEAVCWTVVLLWPCLWGKMRPRPASPSGYSCLGCPSQPCLRLRVGTLLVCHQPIPGLEDILEQIETLNIPTVSGTGILRQTTPRHGHRMVTDNISPPPAPQNRRAFGFLRGWVSAVF